MDPMAWLESLAARQGANPDELTTAADLDIPMPPADSYIDEPGYVDYDPFGGGSVGRTTEPVIRSSTPEPEPQPASDDSMSWLSNLAGSSDSATDDFMSSFGGEPTQAPAELTPMSAEEAA